MESIQGTNLFDDSEINSITIEEMPRKKKRQEISEDYDSFVEKVRAKEDHGRLKILRPFYPCLPHL